MSKMSKENFFDAVFTIFLGKKRQVIDMKKTEPKEDSIEKSIEASESEILFSPQTIAGVLDDRFINKLRDKQFTVDTGKTALIENRCRRINEMKLQIKKILADDTLSKAEKSEKIKRRIDIIHNDEFSILLAMDFIKRRYDKYNEYVQTKQKTR